MTGEPPNPAEAACDFEFAALQEANHYRAALARDFSHFLKGRVIGIGARVGQITAELRKLGGIEELPCVQPDAGFCRIIRALHAGQRLIEGTIKDVLLEAGWEAILSVNVLEHIREDEAELEAYCRLLRAVRGWLCLFVPARPKIYTPIDQDFGHQRSYTRPELARKLEAAGFDIIRLRRFNLVGYLAWWVDFRLRKKRGFEVSTVRVFDRIILPVMHALERRICPPPIGQSLLAVGRARP